MNGTEFTLGEFEPEADAFELDQFEFDAAESSGDQEAESPFDEAEEMELAAELLGITEEAELDQFIGKVFKKVGRGIGKFVRSPVGRALGGVLKRVAKTALPIAGRALGTFVGGPVGGMVGGKLGSLATRLFEVDLEGMEPEDQEFEVARRFVRFAGAATKQAAQSPASVSPQAAAKAALVSAARHHAPGLLKGRAAAVAGKGGRGGRWVRRGTTIVVLGV